MPYIGERLKELRLEKKMTQGELAQALGLSKSAIVQYEHNKREPNLDSLLKIERFFKVSAQYLTCKGSFKRVSEDMFYNNNIQNSDLFHNEDATIQRQVIHLSNEFDYLLKMILEISSPQKKDYILNELYLATRKINEVVIGGLKQSGKMYENNQLDKLELYKLQEEYFQSNISDIECSMKKIFDINFENLYVQYSNEFSKFAGDKGYIQMLQEIEDEKSQQKPHGE